MTASGLARTRLHILAADFARALPGHSTLSKPRGRREGRVLTSHPRSAARKAHAERTAQQHTGGANHSAFPARWSDGLCRALPGAELSLWPPSRSRNSPAPRRLTRSPPPQELGRSNDGQDHTVLPYARPAISLQFSQPCRQSRKLTYETSLSAPFVRAMPRGSRRAIRPALKLSRPTLPRPPQVRLAKTTTT